MAFESDMENIKIRQQFITDAVRRFIKKHPDEYEAVCKSIKRARLNKDKFGRMDNEEFSRWTLRIPEGLFKMLDFTLKNPRFLEAQTEIDWFKKTFPMFRIGEKA